MSDPTLVTTHVTDGLRRLLRQFQGQPNIQGILRSYLTQVQEIENVAISLISERYMANAVGVQLDGVGSIVGEARNARDDTDYRVAIQGRVVRNKANGKIEDIIALFDLILPGHTAVVTQNGLLGDAAIAVTVLDAIAPPDATPAAINAELQKSKGGGVRAYLFFSGFPAAERFTFAPASVPVVDPLRGFADAAQTTGGHFTGLLSS